MTGSEPRVNQPARKWFAGRFSLRTLLIVIALVAVILGVRHRSYSQHSAARVLKSRGVSLLSSHDWKQSTWSRIAFGESLDGVGSVAVEHANLTPAEVQLFREFPDIEILVLRNIDNADQVLTLYPNKQQLTDLVIEKSALSMKGINQLAYFPNLESLELKYLELQAVDLSALSTLPKLRDLVLWGPEVDDHVIQQLSSCPQLWQLWLHETRITEKSYKEISGLATVESLLIRKTPITGAGLEELTDMPLLSRLSLLGSDIDDEGLESIKELRQLTEVDINDTHVTEDGIQSLKLTLPRCRVSSKLDPRPY